MIFRFFFSNEKQAIAAKMSKNPSLNYGLQEAEISGLFRPAVNDRPSMIVHMYKASARLFYEGY
jgi:hypothetical protein